MPMHDFKAQRYLETLSVLPDYKIDLGMAAIAMSAVLHKHRSLQRYIHHFDVLADEVGMRHRALIAEGAPDDAGTALAAMKYVIGDVYGYVLAGKDAEVFDVADPVRVIDTRIGCAAVISLFYLRCGQIHGWDVEGLAFPHYFLCRISGGGQRIIFDAAHGCHPMQAYELRALVKEKAGEKAELLSNYLLPLSARDVLVHVFNIIKTRQIEMGDYAAALQTIGVMRQVHPDEYRLWMDCGVLSMKLGDFRTARADLEAFIARAPDGRNRRDAVLLLDEIRYL